MAIEKIHESLLYSKNAGADLSTSLNLLAHVDVDGDIVLAGAGEHVIGSIYEAAAQDQPVTVQFGGIAKVVAGATVTAGEKVASDGSGKAVPAVTGDYEFGIALETVATDELVPIAVIPGLTP